MAMDYGRRADLRHSAAMFLPASRPCVDTPFPGPRGPLFRTRNLDLRVAPLGIYEFSVITKANVVAREIVPKKTRSRIVDVGHVVIERKFVGNLSLEIIGVLFAAVGDLPCHSLLVGSDCRGRPLMAVTRDFPAVVEIIENPELQREFVLVGRDVLSYSVRDGSASPTFRSPRI